MKIAHTAIVVFVLLATSYVAQSELAFTILGDWGKPIPFAGVIAEKSAQWDSKFVLALGDNFYGTFHKNYHKTKNPVPHGVASVHDPKWKTTFEQIYTHPFYGDKKWYVILGNHDYDGNEKAQLEYAKTHPRWVLPRRYYTFTKKVGNGVTAQFFMLDTTPLYYHGHELKRYGLTKNDMKQVAVLKKALAKSKATWKIVIGHHQVVSADTSNKFLVKTLQPLFEKYKVAAYINGHIHNMQVVDYRKTYYITTGNVACQDGVSKKMRKPQGASVKFRWPTDKAYNSPKCASQACRGFTMMKINDGKTLSFGLYDRRGALLSGKKFKVPNPNRK